MPNKPPLHQVFKPKSDILKQHIISFNVLSDFSPKKEIIYTAFPQRGITVGFFKDSHISFKNNKITIKSDLSASGKITKLHKFISPLKVHYKDFVPKISIHFSELGVNHFFPNYFNEVRDKGYHLMEIEELGICSDKLFAENLTSGMAYLEKKLIELYQPLDLSLFEQAMASIEEDPSIENKDLASQIFVSEKTLSRYFKKYVGTTISEFKRISRFRKVVEKEFNKEQVKMLFLCYDNGYYDPAHFTKSFASITGYSPKQFFKDLEKMGLRNHIYIFD